MLINLSIFLTNSKRSCGYNISHRMRNLNQSLTFMFMFLFLLSIPD